MHLSYGEYCEKFKSHVTFSVHRFCYNSVEQDKGEYMKGKNGKEYASLKEKVAAEGLVTFQEIDDGLISRADVKEIIASRNADDKVFFVIVEMYLYISESLRFEFWQVAPKYEGGYEIDVRYDEMKNGVWHRRMKRKLDLSIEEVFLSFDNIMDGNVTETTKWVDFYDTLFHQNKLYAEEIATRVERTNVMSKEQAFEWYEALKFLVGFEYPVYDDQTTREYDDRGVWSAMSADFAERIRKPRAAYSLLSETAYDEQGTNVPFGMSSSYNLGMLYAKGELEKTDDFMAFALLDTASKKDFPLATRAVARAYRDGIGVRKDYGKYKDIIMSAQPMPDVFAGDVVEILQKEGKTQEALDKCREYRQKAVCAHVIMPDVLNPINAVFYDLVEDGRFEPCILDLELLLERNGKVEFSCKGKTYLVEKMEQEGMFAIKFGNDYFHGCDDFFLHANIQGEPFAWQIKDIEIKE